jgi:thioredoxin-related protein
MKMDNEVYSDQGLGTYMNTNFVSIKVQMDSTSKDNEFVKAWYKDRKDLQKKFGIEAIPTFLFLNEDGILLHRDLGFKNIQQFLSLAKMSKDPNRNFAGLVDKYKRHNLKDEQLLDLAFLAQKIQQDSLATIVATKYKKEYIDKRPICQVLNKGLVKILTTFGSIFSFNDELIRFFYTNPAQCDSVLGIYKGYAKDYIAYLITRDDVSPVIFPFGKALNKTPNFDSLEVEISEKYDKQIAKKIMIDARLQWYEKRNDWQMVIKNIIKRIEFQGIDTSIGGRNRLSDIVFGYIFKHGEDKEDLQKGISYMETILKIDSSDHLTIDTYANILYKAGYYRKALEQENKALLLAEKNDENSSIKEYKNNITKMKHRLPTWN